MISLRQISLRHRTSVFDARSKVRRLTNALGCDQIETNRLATAVSEAANRAKSGFLANMSHELRTPITVNAARISARPFRVEQVIEKGACSHEALLEAIRRLKI